MARPDRATFRLPAVALFVPVLLFVCITPLATADGTWWVLYIVPVLAFVWVLITHTTATAERMTTYGLLGSRSMTWDELDQLELPDARWAIAVGQDGRRLRLPMVRPRDVPRLVAVSGGSLRLGDRQDDDASAEPAAVQDWAATDRPVTAEHTAAAEHTGAPAHPTVAEHTTAAAHPTVAEVERNAGNADPVSAVADRRPAAPDVASAIPPDEIEVAEPGIDGVPLSRVNPRG